MNALAPRLAVAPLLVEVMRGLLAGRLLSDARRRAWEGREGDAKRSPGIAAEFDRVMALLPADDPRGGLRRYLDALAWEMEAVGLDPADIRKEIGT